MRSDRSDPGRLRTYLGIAPGVGKTYAMLRDAQMDRQDGRAMVIGYLEEKNRPDTTAQGAGLERLPLRAVTYQHAVFAEMDTEAILRRRPAVVLVDELAHRNTPGSIPATRWEEVQVLLQEGIDVRTTLNLGNIESLRHVVARMTGTRPPEPVPDGLVAAGDVRLVDLPPDALRRRLVAGSVIPADQASTALGSYFRFANLAALRELAQLWLDDDVADAASVFAGRHAELFPDNRPRIVVGLSGIAGDEVLAAFADELARIDGFRVVGVHVRAALKPTQGSAALAASQGVIAAADGEVMEVVDDDPAAALIRAARRVGAVQLIIGSSRGSRWTHLSRGSTVRRVLRLAGDLPVRVVPV